MNNKLNDSVDQEACHRS